MLRYYDHMSKSTRILVFITGFPAMLCWEACWPSRRNAGHELKADHCLIPDFVSTSGFHITETHSSQLKKRKVCYKDTGRSHGAQGDKG